MHSEKVSLRLHFWSGEVWTIMSQVISRIKIKKKSECVKWSNGEYCFKTCMICFNINWNICKHMLGCGVNFTFTLCHEILKVSDLLALPRVKSPGCRMCMCLSWRGYAKWFSQVVVLFYVPSAVYRNFSRLYDFLIFVICRLISIYEYDRYNGVAF